MKSKELQVKTIEDLKILSGELCGKLYTLTKDARMGHLKKTAEISLLKKELARVQTALQNNQQQ